MIVFFVLWFGVVSAFGSLMGCYLISFPRSFDFCQACIWLQSLLCIHANYLSTLVILGHLRGLSLAEWQLLSTVASLHYLGCACVGIQVQALCDEQGLQWVWTVWWCVQCGFADGMVFTEDILDRVS